MTRLFEWFKPDWERRQLEAMACLVQAVRNRDPDWKQIQIDRKNGGVVFSILTGSRTQVDSLSEVQ